VYEQKGIKAIELVSIGGASSTAGASGTKTAVYTCSMHPEVRQSEPGKCPKCEMNLEKERL
jgi:Cu+-exporting ATPase